MSDQSPTAFRHLRTLVQNAVSTQNGSLVGSIRLELERSRPAFLRLLAKPPQSPDEKAELEKGHFTLTGSNTRKSANNEFKQEALFLSSQLKISERLSASLLDAVTCSHKPRTGRPSAETAILLFYEERRDMLICLETILTAASRQDLEESGLRAVFQDFVTPLVTAQVGPTKTSWVSALIKEISNQSSAIQEVASSSSSIQTQPQPVKSFSFAPQPASSQPSPTTSARLSEDVQGARVQFHKDERRHLATLLYILAYSRLLSQSDIMEITQWVATLQQTDDVIVYAVSSLLAALDTTSEYRLGDVVRASSSSFSTIPPALDALYASTSFISNLHAQIVEKQWSVASARATVQLAWCLFLISAARIKPDLQAQTKIYETTIEEKIIDAVTKGAFQFMRDDMLEFKQPENDLDDLGWLGNTRETTSKRGMSMLNRSISATPSRAPVDTEFEDNVVYQIDTLIVSVISNTSSILRKLKHREEDALLATRSPAQQRLGRSQPAAPSEPRHDIEDLFFLIATLYRSAPDAGLKYWVHSSHGQSSGRLPAFLRWASASQVQSHIRAFFEMLGSLATGEESAGYAFEFLSLSDNGPSSGGEELCSWSSLFGALDYYGGEQDPSSGEDEMPPEEVALLKSFVRLLRIVVQSSPLARTALFDKSHFHPIPTLFNLIGKPVPIDLKAALLEAVNAFCTLGPNGAPNGEIIKKTWSILFASGILPSSGDKRAMRGGIQAELEDVESPSKTYPTTIAFVNLLCTLAHPACAGYLTTTSIASYDSLTFTPQQQLEHHPTLRSFIPFIIDTVLLQSGSREYRDPNERFRVIERCLFFAEQCLNSFDLQDLLVSSSNVNSEAIAQRVRNGAGFDILLKILAGTQLLEELLGWASSGLDAVEDRNKSQMFAICIRRCLVLLEKAMDLETVFLDVVLPSLAEQSAPQLTSHANEIRAAQPLANHLIYNSRSVVAIAVLVNTTRDDELALLAVKLVARLSESPVFNVVDQFRDLYRTRVNRLAGLIDSSDETLRICDGFAKRLDIDPAETAEDEEGSNAAAIRTAIVDLLLANTLPSSQAPNIAHLLLGYDIQSSPEQIQLQDPTASSARISCLHIILELLDPGRRTDDAVPLVESNPLLAEQSYRLLHQLCLHPFTSPATSRYLRTRENYFIRQLHAIPFDIPAISAGAQGTLTRPDSSEVVTSASAVTYTLLSTATFLESLALELNSLVATEALERATDILLSLFEADDDFSNNSLNLNQSLPRIIEIFLSLDFSWIDAVQINEAPLSFLADVSFESCLKQDASGAQIYDIDVILSLISSVQRKLQAAGSLLSQQQNDAFRQEKRAILENVIVENNRREIQSARLTALKAWRNVLEISLVRAFHLVSSPRTTTLLLDLLASIIPAAGGSDLEAGVKELLGGAALLLMTQIRKEASSQQTHHPIARSQLFSTDRLHGVFKSILTSISETGGLLVVRGNLYAVLLQYLRHCAAARSLASTQSKVDAPIEDDDTISLAGSINSTKLVRRNALDSGNASITVSVLDRLLPIICRDAAVGPEVWQTVAYTTLDALFSLVSTAGMAQKMTNALMRQGYLQSFVAGLKDAEPALTEVLRSDPESLNSLYVYEAKMAFFIRLASHTDGAQKLVDAAILPALCQCGFLSARPELDPNAMDFDAFLPPALERYHQLLLPMLQLSTGLVRSLGHDNLAVARQVLNVLKSQKEALTASLESVVSYPTATGLQEAHLITALMQTALLVVSDEDFLSPAGFGSLHAALVAVSQTVLAGQDWVERVEPLTDGERELHLQAVYDIRGPCSEFVQIVELSTTRLQLALLNYMRSATQREGTSHFRPLWLSSTAREQTQNSRPTPTLYHATSFLSDIAGSLKAKIEALTELKFKLDNVEDFGLTELDELASAMLPDEENEVDAATKRQIVSSNLSKLQKTYQSDIVNHLFILETSLLLLWRHASFYLDDDRQSSLYSSARPNNKDLSLEASTRQFLQRPKPLNGSRNLKQDLSDSLDPVLPKLQALKFDKNLLATETRAHEALLETLLRSIQVLVSME